MGMSLPLPNGHAAKWRRSFLLAWTALLLVKLLVAWRLPLFVDEAFYWQEGQHLALAYSDLPGLTAWLTRLGVEIGGAHVLALRLPFIAMAALLPWLVAKVAARWFGETAGWQAGLLTVLMPLSGTLGLLALPDVPMALATALCLDAGARLLDKVNAGRALELALGLSIGALSHYRFIGVIAIGFIALLLIPRGRQLLRDPRVLIALAIGAMAWLPLLAWNFDNGDAGLRFQMVDRHPWKFHADGISFVLVQALLVTPLLFFALIQTFLLSARERGEAASQWRYFGLLGGLSTLGFFVLGFFADNERVSFHWTLPGYLALLAAAPVVLATWWPAWRKAMWAMLLLGLAMVFGWYAMVSAPSLRERLAAEKWYPANFAGWDTVADAVREELSTMPEGTALLADNFKLGAELGFALQDPDIRVLDHPLNHKHGRARQLQLWGLEGEGALPAPGQPVLLVIGTDEVRYKDLLAHYHALCAMVGPIVPSRIVNVDHGAQRFVLVRLPGGVQRAGGACSTPSMAYIDQPGEGARVPRRFIVKGWAFRDGVGLSGVDILIDGKPMARARYGIAQPGVAAYWKISNDPGQPNVGFEAELDLSTLPPGLHWLGLRLTGRDGVVADWSEQPIRVEE